MEKQLENVNRDQNKDEILKVYMLGRFAFEYDGKIVLEDEGRTRKVWMLLGYLLANHNRKLGPHELPELLCSDEKSSDPSRTIKNLVYRLRCMLEEKLKPHENYIQQKGGIYGWNNDIPCVIDTEVFMEKFQKASRTANQEQATALYLEAIDMYQGDFVPHATYDEWAANLTTYYRRVFSECINEVYKTAKSNGNYIMLIPICEKAINIDGYDENIYKIYIESLIAAERHKDAMIAYETITKKLYDDLGVNPSPELRGLYREIVKTLKSVETDIQAIKEDLNESGEAKTTYFCEYEVFKDIYRFIARVVSRTGDSIFIMLFTLTDNNEDMPPKEHLAESMESLKNSIGSTLRKSDLFARYSHSQFVVMLPSITYENCYIVGDRVERAYRKERISRKVKLHYKMQALDPKNQ